MIENNILRGSRQINVVLLANL